MKKRLQTRRGAYFTLLLGIGLIGLYLRTEWSGPRAEKMETVSGRVLWNYERRNELYFSIDGKPSHFVVYAKADAGARMRAAVRDANNAYSVRVTFDPKGLGRSGYVPGEVYAAYGIAVGGKDVVGFDQARSSISRDNLILLGFGILVAVSGVFQIYTLRKAAPSRR
jgi:hypothetical protein